MNSIQWKILGNKMEESWYKINKDINVNLKCLIRFDPNSKNYVSWCPGLDLFSQGDTIQESEDSIKNSIILHLKTIFERKTAGKIL